MLVVGVRNNREPALLDCQAQPSCGQWVKHVFKEARQPQSDDDSKQKPVMADYYMCAACGAERKWG